MIEIKIHPGVSIEDACEKVQNTAYKVKERVRAEFNGFLIDSNRDMVGNIDAYNNYMTINKQTLWHDANEIPIRDAGPLLIEYLGYYRNGAETTKYKTYYVGYYSNELKSAADINFVPLRWCYITDIV